MIKKLISKKFEKRRVCGRTYKYWHWHNGVGREEKSGEENVKSDLTEVNV